jgi:hypothetical protein
MANVISNELEKILTINQISGQKNPGIISAALRRT